MTRFYFYSLPIITGFYHLAFSAAIDNSAQDAAIIPTSLGQIGINPVSDYGPYTQYIAPIGPHTDILFMEDGQTKWRGPDPYYISEVPVTTTIDNQVHTEVSPIMISASKVTASADGMNPGDVTITISPALKSKLEDFVADVVAECKLVIKVKRSDVVTVTEEFTECVNTRTIDATREGGLLDDFLNGIMDMLPEVPPGPAAELDLLAAAMQIARNQVRLRAAFFLSTVFHAYLSTGLIYLLYRMPQSPTNVKPTMTPTATPSGCPPEAPTGIDAPICSDEDCQGLPSYKECSTGEWKGCDCLDTVIVDGNAQLVEPAWLDFQQQLLAEIVSTPDNEVECVLNKNTTDFNGNPTFDPPEWCICREVFAGLNGVYPTITSAPSPCAYTSLPSSQVSIKTLVSVGGSVTSCRSFVQTQSNTEYTSCTCNDNFRNSYMTTPEVIDGSTYSGCDYYLATNTPTPTAPPPTQTTDTELHLPPQPVNLGMVTCLPDHNKGGVGSGRWYMSAEGASTVIDKFCLLWDYLPWPIGPGQEKSSYIGKEDFGPQISPIERDTGIAYFHTRFIGGENCPVLDIGGKDKTPLCKDIFYTIINSCDTTKDNKRLWKQGGRFERDCYQWEMAKHCNVAHDPDCMFKG